MYFWSWSKGTCLIFCTVSRCSAGPKVVVMGSVSESGPDRFQWSSIGCLTMLFWMGLPQSQYSVFWVMLAFVVEMCGSQSSFSLMCPWLQHMRIRWVALLLHAG